MKNTLKTIISTALAAFIMLTGIGLDNTIAADAAVLTFTKDRDGVEDINNIAGTTITMKPGDEKTLDLLHVYSTRTKDATNAYAWTSSDESVVSMRRLWIEDYYGDNMQIGYILIKAEKAGTAVISATNRAGDTVSVTVTVKAPKMTKKQRACKKHAWKTTKKATCLVSGMKTCRKCKLQQVVPKKQHNLKTVTREKNTTTYYVIYQCGACLCEDPSVHYNDDFLCENWCEAEFSQLDYGSIDAAYDALKAHKNECNHFSTLKYIQVPYGSKVHYEDVTMCSGCGYTQKEIDLVYKVNDLEKPVFPFEL